MEVFIGNINWAVLCKSGILVEASKNLVEYSGCDWISSESILECLDNNHVEDATVPQDINSHHAARIAHLIQSIQAGEKVAKIHIHVRRSTSNIKVLIFDGSHRLRAYQYLDKLDCVGAVITGLVSEVKRFVVQ
jgi:hypothetical protein